MRENTKNIINSKILKSSDVIWRGLKFIQQDDFKELSEHAKQKLKNSLVGNNFIQPFYVWEDPQGDIYCLDGRHRTLVLEELITEGASIPELLPATFIDCANEQEAAKLVLIFSSAYAHVTEDGLRDFLSTFDLSSEEIAFQINLPDIDLLKLYGDIDKDFGSANEELDIEAFNDEIILKLKFSKDDYLFVKKRISTLMEDRQIGSPEDLIKTLLQ